MTNYQGKVTLFYLQRKRDLLGKISVRNIPWIIFSFLPAQSAFKLAATHKIAVSLFYHLTIGHLNVAAGILLRETQLKKKFESDFFSTIRKNFYLAIKRANKSKLKRFPLN